MIDPNKLAPDYVLKYYRVTTQRQWRRKKRDDLRALEKAFNQYQRGSAFCPAINGEVGRIGEAIQSLKASHAPAVWGR
jgi:hypothetical protein